MSTEIYFFTGTGNSLKVAKELQIMIGNCKLKAISQEVKQERIISSADVLGIVFPVYWSGPPKIVNQFVDKLNLSDDTYIFAVNTFAAYNGQSIWMLQEDLKKKGLTLNSGYSVWMPGNNQVHYRPFPKFIQKFQFKVAKKKIFKIAEVVKAKRTTKIKKNFQSPDIEVKIVYRDFINKCNSMDKGFWVDDDCNYCGICEKLCPVNNIMVKNESVNWQHNCEFCLACMQWCPKQAIQYKMKTLHKKRYTHPDIEIKELL